MKTKNVLLIILVFFQITLINAQHDPSREVLIYFSEGVTQSIKEINGKMIKVANIQKDNLRNILNKIGINGDSLLVAIPEFRQSDTLKIMPDGIKIAQADMSKLFRYKVPKNGKREIIIESLKKIPEILYAEKNGKISPLVIPSDTRFNEQWGLKNSSHPGIDIHAEAAWNIYQGNSNNIIGIIDGGVEVDHTDLNDKISGADNGYGWNGHGIYVSGIVAAETNNSQGISGVDWNAKIHKTSRWSRFSSNL